MDVYARLGVRPVVNAATTYTRLGGSVMAPAVARAMADAAGCFVDLLELQEAVGRRLAALTGNEAALVTAGAAAGLLLATAACVAGDDPAAMGRLPGDLSGLKDEVVVHRAQRNAYDLAVRQTGARLVEIGDAAGTEPAELDAAIGERTAAVLFFAGPHFNRTDQTLSLPLVIERAHTRGVPVIVDAAAQLPPASNLWRYTCGLGADLALFSGGKGLAGPQNTGLAVGRADLIQAMALNAAPHNRIGRPAKVAKEAMVGLLAAAELFLARDWDAETAAWSKQVDRWRTAWAAVAPAGVRVERDERGEAGEPIPRVLLRCAAGAPLSRDRIAALLGAGDPSIAVVLEDATSVALSPHLLHGDEADLVEARVCAILREAKGGDASSAFTDRVV